MAKLPVATWLVSAVKDVVAGSGLRFHYRGTHECKESKEPGASCPSPAIDAPSQAVSSRTRHERIVARTRSVCVTLESESASPTGASEPSAEAGAGAAGSFS